MPQYEHILEAHERNRRALQLHPANARRTSTATCRVVDGLTCAATDGTYSLVTDAPEAEKVNSMTWSRSFFRDESAELARLPWYRNYRILAAILTAAFLFQLWMFR